MVLPFSSPTPFSLGFPEPEDHLYLTPPGPVLLRVLVQTERCPAPPGQPRSMPTRRVAHLVCPENEIRATPIGICRHIGQLCWSCFTIIKMSCNRDFETDRVFPGEGIPMQGINIRESRPRLCGRWEFVNIRL